MTVDFNHDKRGVAWAAADAEQTVHGPERWLAKHVGITWPELAELKPDVAAKSAG